MAKSNNRPYSAYTRDAIGLLGHLIHEGRLARRLTTTELAQRAGISRSLLQRIERGDPGCSIGAAFEVATLCGVTLFEPDPRALATRLSHQIDKRPLLPKAIRSPRGKVHDDF